MIESMIAQFGKPATIERKTTPKVGAYKTEVWTAVASVKGVLDDTGGVERKSGDMVNVQRKKMFYCLKTDVSEQDRLKVEGKTYNIRNIANPMGASRFLEIELEFNQHEQV